MIVPFEKLEQYETRLGKCLFPHYYRMFSQDYPFEVEFDMDKVRPTTHDVPLDKLFIPFQGGKGLWCFKTEADRNYFNTRVGEMGDRSVSIKD